MIVNLTEQEYDNLIAHLNLEPTSATMRKLASQIIADKGLPPTPPAFLAPKVWDNGAGLRLMTTIKNENPNQRRAA